MHIEYQIQFHKLFDRFKYLNGCKELLSGSIINAIIKSDSACSNECQTDTKFTRHSIFGSSPEPPNLENARRLDRDESLILTLVCISPSSTICIIQYDWLAHKAFKTSIPSDRWNSSNEHRRKKKSKNFVRSKKRGLLFSCLDK